MINIKLDINAQYKAYKERMLIKGHEFMTVSFEEFKEAIEQANKEGKNNGRKHT